MPRCLRRQAHRRHDRDQVHLHDANAVPHRLLVVVAVAVGHRQPVVEEGQVELALLQRAGDALVVLRRHEIGHGLRMPPRRRIVRAVLRLQERHQRHLSFHLLTHDLTSLFSLRGPSVI